MSPASFPCRTPGHGASAPGQSPAPVSRGAVLFVVSTSMVLMPLMMSAVGVSLPAIGRDLAATAMQVGLVETTYVMALSVFLLIMGRLGDIFGRRRLFLAGLVLFTTITAVLSLSQSIRMVIGLRFLQGMGAAMIVANSFAIMLEVFPREERGRAIGIVSAAAYAGISCGPLIGGFLTTHFGWRWVFLMVLPFGISALLLVFTRLRGEWRSARGEPFDLRGSLVYAGAIVLLTLGSSHLDEGSWAWAALAGGLACGGLFLWLESRTPFPLLEVTLLSRNRLFTLSCLSALINYASTFGVLFFLGLYLQYVRGLTPSDAGLLMIIQPVIQMVLSPIGGRLADRFPAERVATVGMVLCAVGLGVAAFIGQDTSTALTVVVLVLLGVGYGLFASPNASAIVGSVEPRHLGVASGMTSTMRTLGMMASMIVVTIVFSVFMGGQPVSAATLPGFLSSMRTALWTFCALCAVGVLLSVGRVKSKGRGQAARTDAARNGAPADADGNS